MKHQNQLKSTKIIYKKLFLIIFYFSNDDDDDLTSVTDARQILERKRRNRK
jgi:hypothetical protein